MFSDQKKYLLLLQVIFDILCLSTLYYYIIPFISIISILDIFPHTYGNTSYYLELSPIFIVCPIFTMIIFKGYNNFVFKNIKSMFIQSLKLSTISIILLSYLSIQFTDFKDLNLNFIIYWIILSFCFILNRFYISCVLKKNCSNTNLIKHILIIGTGQNAQSIADYIQKNSELGLRVVGFLSDKDHEVGKEILNKQILGKVSDLSKVIYANCITSVLYAKKSCCILGENSKELEYINCIDFIITTCYILGIDFATVETQFNHNLISKAHIFLEQIDDIPIKVVKFIYQKPELVFLKRVLDFSLSCILIVIFLPIWIVIGISIKLSSPGPVLFRQERIEKYGRKFTLFKFRSMVVDAEKLQEKFMHLNEMDGPAFKIKNDPRQTTTGKFLRKTSLDELPQLFNVFKGDISFVGPRPAIEKEVVLYRPWERKRLAVNQGITCIWQISGRSTIKFDEWMKLDLMYIDNWNLSMDFRILIMTVPAVLFKKGAY